MCSRLLPLLPVLAIILWSATAASDPRRTTSTTSTSTTIIPISSSSSRLPGQSFLTTTTTTLNTENTAEDEQKDGWMETPDTLCKGAHGFFSNLYLGDKFLDGFNQSVDVKSVERCKAKCAQHNECEGFNYARARGECRYKKNITRNATKDGRFDCYIYIKRILSKSTANGSTKDAMDGDHRDTTNEPTTSTSTTIAQTTIITTTTSTTTSQQTTRQTTIITTTTSTTTSQQTTRPTTTSQETTTTTTTPTTTRTQTTTSTTTSELTTKSLTQASTSTGNSAQRGGYLTDNSENPHTTDAPDFQKPGNGEDLQDDGHVGDNGYYDPGPPNDNNHGQPDDGAVDPVNADIYAYSKSTTTMEVMGKNYDPTQSPQMAGSVAAVVVVVILLMAGLGAGAVLFLKRRTLSAQPNYSDIEDVREVRVGSVSL